MISDFFANCRDWQAASIGSMRQTGSKPGRASLRAFVHACAAVLFLAGTAVFSMAPAQSSTGPAGNHPRQDTCRKVELQGEVNRGQEWRAPIGQGWAFRVIPIAGTPIAHTEFSGWDLAIDRDGIYPDALLLATPPYGSLNQREIATTFGLRAQDAIAWQPREFHFLTSEKDLTQARELYRIVMADSAQARQTTPSSLSPSSSSSLLAIIGDRRRVSAGEFTVLDARLTAGVADPPPYATQWAAQLQQVPHTLVPSSGKPSPLGQLAWMRFRATLWLPTGWRLPPELHAESVKCAE
jgi:hypothetical protein